MASSRRFRYAAAIVLLSATTASAEQAAEIVSLLGRADYRTPPSEDWRPARVKQLLDAGQYVRTTQAESKLALLLADQTQLTLQGIAIAQVKAVAAGGARRSIVDFTKGTGRFQTKTPARDFTVTTPTGLAAIRGTEWQVEVADDGRSVITVIDGELEISNELGSLPVGAGEQGVLEKGVAPSKRLLQDARERVQWVSHFTIDLARYGELRGLRSAEIGAARERLEALVKASPEPAAYFLLADIAIYFGRAREAIARLEEAARRFPEDARTEGLLARAYLFSGDMDKAREAARAALARHPDSLETLLAAGEVARLDGDFPAARAALRRATELAPNDSRAWFALGQLYAERGDPRAARDALARAEALAPGSAQVLAEAGLVEANAYRVELAREILERALAAQPDDFVAWAALGLARLKSGDPEAALEPLLKATLLEPRYARAHIDLAVAYWQQGRTDDALAELRTASLHDPKDPLPYQLASMMQSDLMRPGDALASAREAIARLAYVKSLDAIANDLRGGANLGAPLAQLGLEAWALKNAQDSFDPLWAGSHLFLADRLAGKFTANSELFQGFLADPLAFGASNRFQTLVARPGHYATVAWRGFESSAQKMAEPVATFNGLADEGRVAYFAEGAWSRVWSDDGGAVERAGALTAGLGWKPRDDVGAFLYATRLLPWSRVGFAGRSDFDPFQLTSGASERIDAGLHYRPGPDWQAWLKGGQARETAHQAQREVARSGAAQLLRDSDFDSAPHASDVGARALGRLINGLELSITAEQARYRSMDLLARDTFGRSSAAAARFIESVHQDVRDESRSVALDARWAPWPQLLADLHADRSTYSKDNDLLVRRDFANQRVALTDDYDREGWFSRAGIVAKPFPGATLRAAYQRWQRPVSTGSLQPTSTAGIVLDDRYVLAGGRLTRKRVQAEWEATPTILATAYLDRQVIDNLYSPIIGVLNERQDVSNLERLRNRSFNALATLDALEGFPSLSKGWLRESGFAINALVARQVSIFTEAAWARSANTGPDFPGAMLAFLPKRRYAVGGTFFSDHRWSIAVKATYRGERYSDEANTSRLQAEWSGAVQGYWESVDKRWSIELIATNIGAKSSSDAVGIAVNYHF